MRRADAAAAVNQSGAKSARRRQTKSAGANLRFKVSLSARARDTQLSWRVPIEFALAGANLSDGLKSLIIGEQLSWPRHNRRSLIKHLRSFSIALVCVKMIIYS